LSLPRLPDLIQSAVRLGAEKAFELAVHLQLGEAELPDMPWQLRHDTGPSADQDHLVRGQRPANFQAPKEMTDTENMLAVVDNFHIPDSVNS